MSNQKWYLGRASRLQAEDLLYACGVDGSFVIRSSETVLGAYALSLLHCNAVHTYRILPTDNGMLAVQTLKGVQQRKFQCLDDMVREYRHPQNGLVCGLIHPVGREESNSSKPASYESPRSGFRSELSLSGAFKGANHTSSTPSIHLPEALPIVGEKPDPPLNRHLPPLPPTRDALLRPAAKNLQNFSDSSHHDAEIKNRISSRLNEIKAAWTGTNNNSFINSVQQYTNEGGLKSDLNNVKHGGDHCAQLQTLLAKEAVAFQSELEVFLMKTSILRQLFDFNLPVRKTHFDRNSDVDLDTFLGRLRDCQTVVKDVNKKACSNLKGLLGLPPAVRDASSRKASKSFEDGTERTFEVKQEGVLMKFSKQKLKLDMAKGTLSVIKTDGATEHEHSKVLQLIKNNKSKNKLSIVFDGNKKKDFIFEMSSQREAFCQLMQYIRNKHSHSTEPDCVSIFCGSWNMGDAIPPNDISSWFMCKGSGKCLDQGVQTIPHDIYVIGTQETGMQERDWANRIMEILQDITGGTFHLVVMDALWHIKIMLIVKEEHKNRISHIHTSTVKTGIANALGNKGAVALSFQFGGTSFCFINAHLTSGSEKCTRRNQNYHDIIRSLNLGEDRFRIFELINRFDHLYFFGDLNYRLELEYKDIMLHLKINEYDFLSKFDQLKRERETNKAFCGFSEEEISFPPTYRYERGTRDTYSYLKVKKTGVRVNVPSWCDRVLWRSYPETHHVCHAYGCSDDITTSDHSPIFSNFSVGVRGQYVSKEEIKSTCNFQSSITFENIEVILKSPGKNSFYIQFHSLCLPSSEKSGRNAKLDTAGISPNHVRVLWSGNSLPTLFPIISDREFLIDQHILICVRSDDDNDVQGECVLALCSMIGSCSQRFEEKLTRKGEDTGQMRGFMLVKARESQSAPKEKTYDFIQFNRDEEETKKRKDMDIEVGTYTGIDEIASTMTIPFSQKPSEPSGQAASLPNEIKANPISPEVGVYGQTDDGAADEGEYADPDEVIRQMTASHPTILSTPLPLPNRPPAVPPMGNQGKMFDKEKAAKMVASRKQSTSPTFSHSPSSPESRRPISPVMKAPIPAVRQNRPPLTVEPKRETSSSNGSPVHLLRSNVATNDYDVLTHDGQMRSPVKTSSSPRYPPVGPYVDTVLRPNEDKETPESVEEFLSMINLLQYNSSLQESGWDSIEFLGDLTEDDLNDSGITNPEHCRLILERIQALSL